MRQLAVNDSLSFSEDDYYALIRSKTASLMSAACEVGSIAGASNHREALIQYGDALGMAFQIADDILDIEGTTEQIGKDAGSDAARGKATYPAVMGLAESKQRAAELVDMALESLQGFDEKAEPLREIARYIVSRKS